MNQWGSFGTDKMISNYDVRYGNIGSSYVIGVPTTNYQHSVSRTLPTKYYYCLVNEMNYMKRAHFQWSV